MWEEVPSWFAKFGVAGVIMAGIIILAAIELYSRFFTDSEEGVIAGMIRALRGPRQVVVTTTNVCPKCQKIETKTKAAGQ